MRAQVPHRPRTRPRRALSLPNSAWAFEITMNSKYAPYNHVAGEEMRAATGGLIKGEIRGESYIL